MSFSLIILVLSFTCANGFVVSGRNDNLKKTYILINNYLSFKDKTRMTASISGEAKKIIGQKEQIFTKSHETFLISINI